MKKAITILCLSAAVLTGCQNTTDNGNGNNDTTATKVTTTAETTTAAEDITTGNVTTSTEALTATADTETAPATTHEANVSAGGIQDMYPAIYQGFIKSEFERVAKEHDGLASICYGFRDLDADGIPELIFQRGTCEADFEVNVFTLDSEGEIKDLGMVGGGHITFAYEKDTGDLVMAWGHMGSGCFEYMKMENGVLKKSKEAYTFNFDSFDSYKEIFDEKGIQYMDYADVYQSDPDSGATSWFYHADGTTEEIKGAYFDYCI
ncbi:hypothetical protein [Ruminococcus sp.]|uniref:hypothetical protein n=1 Tax=Ruminococcus sp. TaxID=41978 RepID=UPI0025D3F2DC|nr:hypothetical protein [Ruminococcus sp.]